MHPTSSASSVSPSSPDLPPICSRSADLPPQELVLLDLLGAPPGSFLESLGAVLSRVDSLAHVLAWARYDEEKDLSQPLAVAQSELAIVSLPRLKLSASIASPASAVAPPPSASSTPPWRAELLSRA